MSTDLVKRVEEYVRELFKDKVPPENVYHNLIHTTEVVSAVREIAKAEQVTDEDLELILIAAWFHDTGYIETCKGHEEISKNYAKEYLSSINFPGDKIDKILSLIDATRVPQEPKNKLEEILCDADLHHLGTNDFQKKGELFRLELKNRNVSVSTDEEWLKTSIDFFKNHHYFTNYAVEKYEIQKNINLLKLEKKLKKLKKKSRDEKFKNAKLALDKEKIEQKKKQDKQSGRGIETMFRNVMRTHVSFSSMADNKAQIMFSVNVLVLTILVSVMIRKLDTNPHLIIPTALLTITCLVSLVLAIIVTRPKVTSGKFTREDIHSKKVNLLFFGNFYNMGIDEFIWGMKEMMNDKDYLYLNMIKDFYYLGQVLGKKYKLLRICYTFFMYGVIISIIAYAIAFIMYPHGTDLGPIIN